MDKLVCYKKLFEIRDHYNVDVSPYIQKIAGSSVIDPSVIAFINEYDSPSSLNEDAVHNLYNRRHKNPLYKSLVNESGSEIDKLIALSSYITRMLIDSKQMADSDRQKFLSEMQVHLITESISSYLAGSSTEMLSTFDKIRSMIKSIINEESEVKTNG